MIFGDELYKDIATVRAVIPSATGNTVMAIMVGTLTTR